MGVWAREARPGKWGPTGLSVLALFMLERGLALTSQPSCLDRLRKCLPNKKEMQGHLVYF